MQYSADLKDKKKKVQHDDSGSLPPYIYNSFRSPMQYRRADPKEKKKKVQHDALRSFSLYIYIYIYIYNIGNACMDSTGTNETN